MGSAHGVVPDDGIADEELAGLFGRHALEDFRNEDRHPVLSTALDRNSESLGRLLLDIDDLGPML